MSTTQPTHEYHTADGVQSDNRLTAASSGDVSISAFVPEWADPDEVREAYHELGAALEEVGDAR